MALSFKGLLDALTPPIQRTQAARTRGRLAGRGTGSGSGLLPIGLAIRTSLAADPTSLTVSAKAATRAGHDRPR